jgi:hypothetical protein
VARLARANDGDDVAGIIPAALRVAGGRAAGNVVAIDLVVGRSFRKSLCLAVGVGGGRPAFFPRREAAVDAVAVGVVGHDDHPALGICRSRQAQAQHSSETDRDRPHYENTREWRRRTALGADSQNVSKIVKQRITGYQLIFHTIILKILCFYSYTFTEHKPYVRCAYKAHPRIKSR